MLNKNKIIASLAGMKFFLAITSAKVVPQMTMEMPIYKEDKVQFCRIEQPLGLKAAVTLGGIGLIGLELW